jgi:hypothetical protein
MLWTERVAVSLARAVDRQPPHGLLCRKELLVSKPHDLDPSYRVHLIALVEQLHFEALTALSRRERDIGEVLGECAGVINERLHPGAYEECLKHFKPSEDDLPF